MNKTSLKMIVLLFKRSDTRIKLVYSDLPLHFLASSSSLAGTLDLRHILEEEAEVQLFLEGSRQLI